MLKKIISALLISVVFISCGVTAVLATGDDLPILSGRDFQQGDVNLDTKVNIKDATLIQKHLAKVKEISVSQLLLADVDGKEGVSIKDATHLQKWIAGLTDELWAPQDESVPETTATEDLPIFGEIVTKPAESAVTTSATEAVKTEPTETEAATEQSSSALTEPSEEVTTEASAEATDGTEEPDKPITLPFVPAP